MKAMNTKMYKFFLVVCVSILTILIFLTTYNYIKGNTLTSEDKRLISYIDKIHSQNSYLSEAVAKDSYKVEKAIELIPLVLSELRAIESDLFRENVSGEAATFITSLNQGLDKNIVFLEQLKLCLENLEAKDLYKSLSQLTTLKTQCLEGYNSATYKEYSGALEDREMEFFHLSLAYLNEVVQLNRDSDIASSQKNDFITSMDNIVASFNKINSNYSIPLNRVREDKGSYSGIIKSIDKDTEVFVDITRSFNSLSIPNDGFNSFNSFKACLDYYSSYIQGLRNAVMHESQKSNNLTQDYLDNLYSLLNERYEEIQMALKTFNYTYEGYKSK